MRRKHCKAAQLCVQVHLRLNEPMWLVRVLEAHLLVLVNSAFKLQQLAPHLGKIITTLHQSALERARQTHRLGSVGYITIHNLENVRLLRTEPSAIHTTLLIVIFHIKST